MCNIPLQVISECVGTCKEEGVDVEAQKAKCHSEEEKLKSMSFEELKEEVKRLRMMAVKSATALHDLAEEGLPSRWEEIPKVAQEAYEIHRSYFKAKKILDERSRGQ